ncbi:MAG: hypothetical protein BWY79_02009 [Actinobacteria bacterium ADurb.Bin444]|nr:MAG: hypothetical protein BWY79_02009 [Actinobacteria bacterium ADurb.Bin444]
MDDAGDRETIFELFVFHAVTTHQNHFGFVHLVQAAAERLPKHGDIHVTDWETNDIQGSERPAAFGIDIAQ